MFWPTHLHVLMKFFDEFYFTVHFQSCTLIPLFSLLPSLQVHPELMVASLTFLVILNFNHTFIIISTCGDAMLLVIMSGNARAAMQLSSANLTQALRQMPGRIRRVTPRAIVVGGRGRG